MALPQPFRQPTTDPCREGCALEERGHSVIRPHVSALQPVVSLCAFSEHLPSADATPENRRLGNVPERHVLEPQLLGLCLNTGRWGADGSGSQVSCVCALVPFRPAQVALHLSQHNNFPHSPVGVNHMVSVRDSPSSSPATFHKSSSLDTWVSVFSLASVLTCSTPRTAEEAQRQRHTLLGLGRQAADSHLFLFSTSQLVLILHFTYFHSSLPLSILAAPVQRQHLGITFSKAGCRDFRQRRFCR